MTTKNALAPALEPGLYVTATPIGNLGDITYRAVATMKAADLILCEDTRHTGALCAAYDIRTPRAPYHEHNGEAVRPGILKRLGAGEAICLVSDAGTPLISDPGFKLVQEARAAGLGVFALPGPCAAIAALSVAGAPTDRFYFAGFPPAKSGQRTAFLKNLTGIDASLVFYEAPGRLTASLAAIDDVLPGRTVRVARELTKKFETIHEGLPGELIEFFDQTPPRGEIVVVVGPPDTDAIPVDLDGFLTTALAQMSVRDAAAAAADALGIPKKDAYDAALRLAKDKPREIQ